MLTMIDLIDFAVRLGKVSLSRACHPLPCRCWLWFGAGFFFG
jgi:hypothetical protein